MTLQTCIHSGEHSVESIVLLVQPARQYSGEEIGAWKERELEHVIEPYSPTI